MNNNRDGEATHQTHLANPEPEAGEPDASQVSRAIGLFLFRRRVLREGNLPMPPLGLSRLDAAKGYVHVLVLALFRQTFEAKLITKIGLGAALIAGYIHASWAPATERPTSMLPWVVMLCAVVISLAVDAWRDGLNKQRPIVSRVLPHLPDYVFKPSESDYGAELWIARGKLVNAMRQDRVTFDQQSEWLRAELKGSLSVVPDNTTQRG